MSRPNIDRAFIPVLLELMSDPGSRRGPDVPLQACRALNYFLQVRQGVKSRDRAAWCVVVLWYPGSSVVHMACIITKTCVAYHHVWLVTANKEVVVLSVCCLRLF